MGQKDSGPSRKPFLSDSWRVQKLYYICLSGCRRLVGGWEARRVCPRTHNRGRCLLPFTCSIEGVHVMRGLQGRGTDAYKFIGSVQFRQVHGKVTNHDAKKAGDLFPNLNQNQTQNLPTVCLYLPNPFHKASWAPTFLVGGPVRHVVGGSRRHAPQPYGGDAPRGRARPSKNGSSPPWTRPHGPPRHLTHEVAVGAESACPAPPGLQ
jgi:hypothetical protein